VNATLSQPKGLAVDTAGNVYIGDTSNARLRKVDTDGMISTVAGPGILGRDYWNAVTFDQQGNLYVTVTHIGDAIYSVIDRVNADGTLTPVAGNAQNCSPLSQRSFPFDGAQAKQVPLCLILGVAFDAQGVMYIPEAFYGSVLRVAQDGTIRRIAGSLANFFVGDGGSPLLASLQGGIYFSPSSVALDASGDIFLPTNTRVREITAAPLRVQLSLDHIDFQGSSAKTVEVLTNVAEPLPFGLSVTGRGSTWLSTNRVTGQTGDMVTLVANPSGLAPGVYTATVQIVVPGAATPPALPVTLTIP
jgi:sugar lactone lactonase YvrE